MTMTASASACVSGRALLARRLLSSSSAASETAIGAARRAATSTASTASTASPTSTALAFDDRAKSLVRGLAGRSLLRVDDYSPAEMDAMLRLSHHLKRQHKAEHFALPAARVLQGKSLAMIFQKRSTRTRVSTETGAALLGMQSLFLGSEDVQLGVNESLRDTAVVLARYNSLILARVFGHDTVATLAKHSTVPVINALSNSHHPLQSLADVMTLQEHFGPDVRGLTVSWVGDGNNVLADLMLASVMAGCKVRVATPKNHEPAADVVASARAIVERAGGDARAAIQLFNEPTDAIRGADVVVTDTWVSMGQESQKQARLKTFAGYKITRDLVERGGARPGWKFMHCLPRHPEEVDDDVFDDPRRSIVFDEAENRMYTVMAVMLAMLGRADAV